MPLQYITSCFIWFIHSFNNYLMSTKYENYVSTHLLSFFCLPPHITAIRNYPSILKGDISFQVSVFCVSRAILCLFLSLATSQPSLKLDSWIASSLVVTCCLFILNQHSLHTSLITFTSTQYNKPFSCPTRLNLEGRTMSLLSSHPQCLLEGLQNECKLQKGHESLAFLSSDVA